MNMRRAETCLSLFCHRKVFVVALLARRQTGSNLFRNRGRVLFIHERDGGKRHMLILENDELKSISRKEFLKRQKKFRYDLRNE